MNKVIICIAFSIGLNAFALTAKDRTSIDSLEKRRENDFYCYSIYPFLSGGLVLPTIGSANAGIYDLGLNVGYIHCPIGLRLHVNHFLNVSLKSRIGRYTYKSSLNQWILNQGFNPPNNLPRLSGVMFRQFVSSLELILINKKKYTLELDVNFGLGVIILQGEAITIRETFELNTFFPVEQGTHVLKRNINGKSLTNPNLFYSTRYSRKIGNSNALFFFELSGLWIPYFRLSGSYMNTKTQTKNGFLISQDGDYLMLFLQGGISTAILKKYD